MPLGNISGVYTTIPVMLKGQRAVLLERFTVRDWHEHVLRYRPQVSGLPPAGVQMVLDADIPPADLACIRSHRHRRRAVGPHHASSVRGALRGFRYCSPTAPRNLPVP